MRSRPRKSNASTLALTRRLLQAKERRRRELAGLPIEEKFRILVKMQKLASETRQALGRSSRSPWRILE